MRQFGNSVNQPSVLLSESAAATMPQGNARHQLPYCSDDGAASVRRQFPTMGERAHEGHLQALWRHRVPAADWGRRQGGGRMFDLRKSFIVRSIAAIEPIDVARQL
jgi:hypothetical protein